MTPDREERLRALGERLGYNFKDLTLPDRALTHSSWAHESLVPGAVHNEPLEFLGDAVLGFVVTDLLHRRDPDGDEGRKTKTRAQLVSASSLAQRAAELGLPELLLLGRGEEKTGGRKKTALWANGYEALIAALYLDGGIEAAHRFIRDEFRRALEDGGDAIDGDHKSALQEVLQGRGESRPEYVVVSEEGPSHQRRFRVACVVLGRTLAEGEGSSKKTAQQEAARKALQILSGSQGSGD